MAPSHSPLSILENTCVSILIPCSVVTMLHNTTMILFDMYFMKYLFMYVRCEQYIKCKQCDVHATIP